MIEEGKEFNGDQNGPPSTPRPMTSLDPQAPPSVECGCETPGLKIGVIGSAGTGKTTIAKGIASGLGLPLFAARKITSEILCRDGYDYADDIQVERFLGQGFRQEEILDRTIQIELETDAYVTDRTVIDLVAYAITELHTSNQGRVHRFWEVCQDFAPRYTHLFFTPWGIQPLRDNNIRTLNPWYQFLIHSTELSIINQWGLRVCVLDDEDSQVNIEKAIKHVG